MKNKIILSLFFLLPFLGFSQVIDTIEINLNNTATIVFNSKIQVIVIGNNSVIGMTEDEKPLYKYYDKLILDNMVIIRAKLEDIPTTTLTIKLSNDKIFFFILEYKERCKKHLYNIENKNKKKVEIKYEEKNNKTKKNNNDVDTSTTLEKRIIILRKKKSNINDIAVIRGKVIFKISNIMYDDKYTYIKIIIANRSSNNYIIDGIMYKYIEGKKRFFNKKEVENIKWLKAVYDDLEIKNEIREKTKKEFCFVIPIYNIPTGYLLVKIIEKNGNRNADLYIKTSVLQNSNIF